jgi:hypothetical protein
MKGNDKIIMDSGLKIFKDISTCELDDNEEYEASINMLEGATYYCYGYKLVDILQKLLDNGYEFEIIQGFKGNKVFDKCNKFKYVTIKPKLSDDIDSIIDIISEDESFDVKTKGKAIRIKVKE